MDTLQGWGNVHRAGDQPHPCRFCRILLGAALDVQTGPLSPPAKAEEIVIFAHQEQGDAGTEHRDRGEKQQIVESSSRG